MADEVQPDGVRQQLERLRVLESLAWECLNEANSGGDTYSFKDRLAALKMVTDLVLVQLRFGKELEPKEDTESAEFYMEQYRALKERVDQLARRRRAL